MSETMHEILHILTDPAHWVGEIVMDGTLTLLAIPTIRAWVKRHDRKKHGVPPSTKPYLSYYTSADMPGPASSWSVWSEWYESVDADEPIEGTSRHVSTHPDSDTADTMARHMQALWARQGVVS